MLSRAADVSFILDKVRGQHFQVACGKFFEAKHKGSTLIETELGGITHPNQYFEESTKFYAPADGGGAAGAPKAEAKAEAAGSTQFTEEPVAVA